MNNALKKSIKKYQETQDLLYQIQKLSNEVRAKSKKVIALLRRDNLKEGEKVIKEIENVFRLINRTAGGNRELTNQGFYREGVEEYVEAITFYNFLTKSDRKIPQFVEVGVEGTISGICDFTGELLRKAITIASPENFKRIEKYRKVVESVVEQLTKIGFRGKLRQKYDESERNLKKMENILYDIKLKNRI